MHTVRRLAKLAIKSLFGNRIAEVWQSPQEELDAFQEKILLSMARLPDKLADKSGLFAHFNKGGSQAPVFWCFNNWSEAVFLAYHLGPDRPLYAMHSLYQITEDEAKKSMHTAKLAETYGDLLCNLYPDGPVLLGGNCQAASIAEATAHYLMGKREKPPMLITLEYQPFYSYPGNLLMLFGDRSEDFNPFLNDESPVTGWQNKHQNVVWGFINGAHGEYFREPGVHQLAWYIKHCGDNIFIDVRSQSGELAPESRVDRSPSNVREGQVTPQ